MKKEVRDYYEEMKKEVRDYYQVDFFEIETKQ